MRTVAMRSIRFVPIGLATIAMADSMLLRGALLPWYGWGALLVLSAMATALAGRITGRPDSLRSLHLVLMGALLLAMNPTRAIVGSSNLVSMPGMRASLAPLGAALLLACCVVSCASVFALVRRGPSAAGRSATGRVEHGAWAALMAGMVFAMLV